jgi:DNA-directed RNA polymerase III subunit RPC6
VYNAIYTAGRSGMWLRSIPNKSNVLKAEVDRCLKSLEGKKLIKTIQVKGSKKKMYMLYSLQPSVEITGGAWFTDGMLDVYFIEELARWTERFVSKESWYEVETSRADRDGGKRQKTNKGDVRPVKEKTYLSYPAAYEKYPTVTDVTVAINNSGVTPVRMDENNVRELLQVLCFDNKLVELDNGQYKTLNNPDQVIHGQRKVNLSDGDAKTVDLKNTLGKNGMTEAPCGQCPVFKLCQPGGAVSPESCEYFGPWMQKVLGF